MGAARRRDHAGGANGRVVMRWPQIGACVSARSSRAAPRIAIFATSSRHMSPTSPRSTAPAAFHLSRRDKLRCATSAASCVCRRIAVRHAASRGSRTSHRT